MSDGPEDDTNERQGWFAAAVLFFAYALILADRQIIAFLVDPISADLQISDFQFSLISGFFVVSVASVLGVPLAKYSDSDNRRDIIAVCIAVWSLMTVLCSRATGLVTLMLARFGSGLARAVLVPASVSLLGDSFSAERRPLAINLYTAGAFVGIGLANMLSGVIVAATTSAEGLILPLTGRISGWQLAFLCVALPAIIVLALLRRVNEPQRHSAMRSYAGASGAETLAYVRKDWFVFTSLTIGAVLSGAGLFAVFAWVPTVFSRNYGWSGLAIGLTFGLITIVFATAGLVMSGRYAAQFAERSRTLMYQRLMMLAVACAIIPGAFTMTADTALGAWACYAGVIFFLVMPVGLVQTAILAITPNGMRARLVATYLAALNIVGMGLGPVAVAFITDFVMRDPNAMDRAIGLVIVASGVASVLLLALGVKQYEEMGRDR